MSKLIKEEVIAQFTEAYLAKHGNEPTIEQKGSWFKVDGGKSLRLGDLAEMAQSLADQPSVEKASPKTAPVKSVASHGGKTAKQLWADRIANGGKLPRGF
ncbi:hypothetical protein [Ferrimonas gelatinilytica]|uniref:Uncharacterized protein n=1 Tax=Ferrimonas gelatinilytica TaxID=1255257 RepID=A0ABP9RWF2_9GAMM